MNQLAEMIAQKFNLSPELSQQIVGLVAEHLKSRLPEGMGSQLEALLAGGGAESGGLIEKVKSMAAGMMNKE